MYLYTRNFEIQFKCQIALKNSSAHYFCIVAHREYYIYMDAGLLVLRNYLRTTTCTLCAKMWKTYLAGTFSSSTMYTVCLCLFQLCVCVCVCVVIKRSSDQPDARWLARRATTTHERAFLHLPLPSPPPLPPSLVFPLRLCPCHSSPVGQRAVRSDGQREGKQMWRALSNDNLMRWLLCLEPGATVSLHWHDWRRLPPP